MSATGLFIFLIAIIGIAVLGALIAVIAAVSGASAAKITDKVQERKTFGNGCLFFVSKKKIKLSEILL